MLPLSYQGFGFTAILLMVLFLSFVEAVKWLKNRARHDADGTATPKILKADPGTVRVGTQPLNDRSNQT